MLAGLGDDVPIMTSLEGSDTQRKLISKTIIPISTGHALTEILHLREERGRQIMEYYLYQSQASSLRHKCTCKLIHTRSHTHENLFIHTHC